LHRGGDGVVRSIRVLEPATVSLLTDRRRHAPAGAHGGGPGTPGRNLVGERGREVELPPKITRQLDAGEVVTVVTPGGGGWGRAD
jgi:N-methylhydantoinase B